MDQENSSSINQFYKLQVQQPTNNDWASSCLTLINQLQTNISIDEIKIMYDKNFKDIVRTKINSSAFEYFMKKNGSKGIEICYKSLEMAEYLTPMNNEITIEEKQNLYAIRIRMFEISSNFTYKTENKSL